MAFGEANPRTIHVVPSLNDHTPLFSANILISPPEYLHEFLFRMSSQEGLFPNLLQLQIHVFVMVNRVMMESAQPYAQSVLNALLTVGGPVEYFVNIHRNATAEITGIHIVDD